VTGSQADYVSLLGLDNRDWNYLDADKDADKDANTSLF
jgi:hypothetical protein